MKPLYQENPRVKSTYTQRKNRSMTDSFETNQNGASKKSLLLRLNNRLPTIAMTLHFLKVFSVQEIKTYRTKIFRYLKEHGIEAVAAIELTKDVYGNPNNTVHFHILTDDKRSQKELRKLFNDARERRGLIRGQDFRVDYKKLYDPDWYFDYFTKRNCRDVILFKIGTGLYKFYQIGKWFKKSQSKLWKDFIRKIYGTG